jgi:hypothetical protein
MGARLKKGECSKKTYTGWVCEVNDLVAITKREWLPFRLNDRGFMMRGTIREQEDGINRMRVGYAGSKFSKLILFVSLIGMIFLAWWVYREIPATGWRVVNFLLVYLVAVVLYANFGVWIHEQLHCLAFRGTPLEKRTQITFTRKYILALSGHYIVKGEIDYRTLRRALLAPFGLVVGLGSVGLIGSLFLPGWWFPLLLSMALAGVLDMTHDLYWVSQIRPVGDKGSYRDNGHELLVVWKDQ